MKLLSWTIRPSKARALADRLSRGQDLEVFLHGVSEFLTDVQLDGGATNDLIVSTARELSAASIWQHVPATKLTSAIKFAPDAKVALFLEGLPSTYRKEIETSLATSPVAKSWHVEFEDIVAADLSAIYMKISDVSLREQATEFHHSHMAKTAVETVNLDKAHFRILDNLVAKVVTHGLPRMTIENSILVEKAIHPYISDTMIVAEASLHRRRPQTTVESYLVKKSRRESLKS